MRALFFCGIAFLFLIGCSDRQLVWEEDVLLPDGRIVTVHRVQSWFKGRKGEAGDYSIEFKDPDTGQSVNWSHDRDLTTVALFKQSGQLYLLLKPLWVSSHSRFRCPNPSYFLKTYRSGHWEDVRLQDVPVKSLKVNMTDNIFDRVSKIEQDGHRLSVAVTQSRTVRTDRPPYVAPYVMDFSNVKEQTFGYQNCGKINLLYADQTP